MSITKSELEAVTDGLERLAKHLIGEIRAADQALYIVLKAERLDQICKLSARISSFAANARPGSNNTMDQQSCVMRVVDNP
jgi:hypothetical protein